MSDVLTIYHRAPKPNELVKAMNEQKELDQQHPKPKSAIIDPVNGLYYGGTRGKPTPIPYATLRRMAQVPAISAIINTRLNQVASFAKLPRFKGDTGFRIRLKDTDAKMTEAQKKRAKEIEQFFLKTGWLRNPVRKDNFNTFLRKITRDSLELDVMTFEKVPNLKGDLTELWAIDASTIELVLNNPLGEGTKAELPVYKPETKSGLKYIGNIAYVQKINGVVTAEYTEDDLAFAVRNPRTDIRYADFGMSELETLIEIVTGIVNGVRYNTSYFSHSHLPQGVLEIVGKYDDTHLEAFQRYWKNLTSGASGKWTVPVMAMEEGQGFKFTPFKNSNRDMEFNEFLEFLFNITCAVYQIDPNEVGFKSWTSGSSMTQSDNTQAKIDQSRDKGFAPLMTFLSDTFNSEIVELIDDEFVFEWVGVDEEDEDKKLERIEKRLAMGLTTVAEERKNEDLDELLDENGNPQPWTLAPANATLMQAYNAHQQMQQADAQQQQAGAEATLEQQKVEAERAHEKESSEVAHQRQLELMDKQHQQNVEIKKMDHEHQKEMAKLGAEQKAKSTENPKKKDDIKKSIEDEFKQLGIDIDWSDY